MIVDHVEVDRYLRNKDAVSLCADAAAQGSMSDVSAEDLHYHDAVVAHAGSLEVRTMTATLLMAESPPTL